MMVLYTDQALDSFKEALSRLATKISAEKLSEIKDQVLDSADSLAIHPTKGQFEPFLDHLSLGHRRIIEGNFKIIYRVVGDIVYITDIFDSRQDPVKMKS